MGSSSASTSPPDRSLALVSFVMGASFVSQTTLALAGPALRAATGCLGRRHRRAGVAAVLAADDHRDPHRPAREPRRAAAVMLGGAVGMTLGAMVHRGVPSVSRVDRDPDARRRLADLAWAWPPSRPWPRSGNGGRSRRAFGWYTTSVSLGQLVGPSSLACCSSASPRPPCSPSPVRSPCLRAGSVGAAAATGGAHGTAPLAARVRRPTAAPPDERRRPAGPARHGRDALRLRLARGLLPAVAARRGSCCPA